MFTKRIIPLLVLAIFLTTLCSISAAADSSENDCIYYFYSRDCSDCQSVDVFFSTLETTYPNLNVKKYEVYHNYKNYLALQDYFKAYSIKSDSRSIPAVFIGSSYFIGKESITSFLEQRILDNSGSDCPSIPVKDAVGIVGSGEPSNVLSTLTFSKITADAVRNMFNPGIIALLIVMAALLLGTSMVIKKGIIYIIGVFSAYFLFAIGFFGNLYSSQLNLFFYKFIGILAVLLGLAGIRSILGSWNHLLEKIPADLKRYYNITVDFLHSYLGFFTSGLILSLFTFASVGESFFTMRNIFAEGFMRGIVVPMILYYDFILMLIFAVVLFGLNSIKGKLNLKIKESESSEEHKEKSKKHYNNMMNLTVRIIILVIGLILLFV